MKPLILAEIQGLYGPVTIAERLLQKIWWRGEFNQACLRTIDGKSVERIHSGRWNMQEGPDFIGTTLRIGGQEIIGDIEVHFYADDWDAHGHNSDPAFANVVLHILLFPPSRPVTCETYSGRRPETLVLLPYLNENIEDYAGREALLTLESREKSTWFEKLCSIPEDGRIPLLLQKSRERWRQKVHFAKQRLDNHGWAESCHQLMLETLGLNRNRAPMATLGQRHPLGEMRDMTPTELFAEQKGRWRLSGLRPANYPLRRLEQYTTLLTQNPHWPEALQAWGDRLSLGTGSRSGDTASFRKAMRFPLVVKALASGVLAGAVGGTRLHTLVIDAFLPLLAAGRGAPDSYWDYWYHWLLGDIPSGLARDLRAGLGSEKNPPPVMNNGLFQGLLQLSHELG
jgi:hypothetical protein